MKLQRSFIYIYNSKPPNFKGIENYPAQWSVWVFSDDGDYTLENMKHHLVEDIVTQPSRINNLTSEKWLQKCLSFVTWEPSQYTLRKNWQLR